MPVIMRCPKCNDGIEKNHGFGITNGGMWFYHNNPFHRFYIGDDDKVYSDELSLFKAIVIPRTPKNKASEAWIKGRLADLTGHPRTAKRYYNEWHKLADLRV